MKLFFLIHFTLFFSIVNAQNNKSYFKCDVEDISFSEFTQIIEKETNIKVFHQSELVNDIKITLRTDSISVYDALTYALENTNLKVSKWHKNYVVLENNQLLETLPAFHQEQKDILNDEYQSKTKTEERYLSGRRSDVINSIQVGTNTQIISGPIKIAGKVTDITTGEPIIGATIYIEETKTGAATDLNGFFNIILPQGGYNATFSSLGYNSAKYMLNIYSEGFIKIEMESTTFSLQEAVIKGDRQMDIQHKDPGLEKLTVKSIKAIPMMMGDRDILKVSEMLPGIVSAGEGSSGLNVRGGSSDQNAFYINKIPIYNTSHLFGFYPSFNSDIIKDFAIYKGHIPAQYGGRLSSVFNIITRQGNRKEFSVRGGINPIAANITAEGPVIKDKSSILISGRSSYSDWILRQISNPDIRNSSANFYDFSLNYNYDFEKTLLSAFVYLSKDQFDFSDINEYDYSNAGASINLYHNFNTSFRVDAALIGSQYSFNTIDKQQLSSAYEYAYKINHYELKSDFSKMLSASNNLNYGFSAILYQLNKGPLKPYGNESLRQIINHNDEQGAEASLYIEDRFDLNRWFNITAGFKYIFYSALAKNEIYTYSENQSKDISTISDTLNFSKNKPVKWYSSPEFRISLNIKTDNNGSVKFAFNQTSQNLFMLNNTITIAPNTQWKLADYHLKPAKSNQYSFGIFRNFPKSKLETSIEIFYKNNKNYSEFIDGADFLNNPITETQVLQGNQKSYGLEFLIKKNGGMIDGWLAYTYSRSFVKIDGNNSWDQINFGKQYPSNYDIPHVINSVINLNISKRVTLSSVCTYQTGKPTTYPVSVYYIDDIPMIDYNERNKYRIPDYFRTDLSLSIEGNLKKDKMIHSSWMFSVYNVTGRKNAYSVFFTSEEGKIKSYKYSVIGTPFLTVTWLFKLGNYASQ